MSMYLALLSTVVTNIPLIHPNPFHDTTHQNMSSEELTLKMNCEAINFLEDVTHSRGHFPNIF